jgi:hypothetical protein
MTGVINGAGTFQPSRFHTRFLVAVRVAGSLVFCIEFCRSLFVLLALCCLSFFDLLILSNPLVSSSSLNVT